MDQAAVDDLPQVVLLPRHTVITDNARLPAAVGPPQVLMDEDRFLCEDPHQRRMTLSTPTPIPHLHPDLHLTMLGAAMEAWGRPMMVVTIALAPVS